MNKPARAIEYVGHIVQAIERIEEYTEDLSEQAFQADRMRQDAVIRNLEIVGEASRNLERYCPEFLAAYPDLPIIQAYEMRNALSHGYFRVDLQIIWETIQHNLPPLHRRLVEVMNELNPARRTP
jgi:uncharacterized protein with HEPN domain